MAKENVVSLDAFRRERYPETPKRNDVILFQDWMLYASDIEFQGLPVEVSDESNSGE